MSNVRIGPDGSIIKDDIVVESDGRTVIREDGTIESTSVGGSVNAPIRTPVVAMPPVSPLEGTANNISNNNYSPVHSSQNTPVNTKAIKEKEYDIQMQEARIRGAVPKNMIVATIVLCILGVMGLYFLFIPAIVTGILIVVGFSKKSELEAQRDTMYRELDEMKSRSR